jgi:hypothetical protein
MPDIGTRISHVAGNAALAVRTISSGSMRVLGVLVANNSANPDLVTIQNNAGTTIMSIVAGGNSSEDFAAPFIADSGFIVVSALSAATTFVTVVHGQDGA